MTASFDGIEFSVYPDGDGFLPAPVAPEGENGPRVYTATVRILSGTDITNLREKKSIATIVPAMGFIAGGSFIVEAGIGSRVLIYPSANGAEVNVDAILTGISHTAHMVSTDRRVDLTFILVE